MTLRPAFVLLVALLASGLCATVGPGAAGPSSRPTDSRPASAPADVDPATAAILKRLEAAADKHPNVVAGLDYLVEMVQAGDTERRTGKVYYQAATDRRPPRFRIHFDTLRQSGGPKIRNVVDYVFDGSWLTVRKERLKQLVRYKIPTSGRKVNPMQLGQGPFPVPFGQKADVVVKYFACSTRPPAKTDPPGTDYVKLVTRPRRQRQLNLKWIEMWVQRKTGLPVKMVAEDRSENRSTVVFAKIETPKAFPPKTFDLPDPPRGWDVRVENFTGRIR